MALFGSRVVSNVISQGEVMPEKDGLSAECFLYGGNVDLPLHMGRMLYRHEDRGQNVVSVAQAKSEILSKH